MALDVLVFVVDDYPYLHGTTLIDSMPNTKTIFKDNGVFFSNYHVQIPRCAPSRVAMLTGKYAHEAGNNVDQNDWGPFAVHTESLPIALHNAGYRTHLVGKYLNRYGGGDANPEDRPDYDWVAPGWDRWIAADNPAYYDYTLLIDKRRTGADFSDRTTTKEEHESGAEANYSTAVYQTKAVADIAACPAGTPLFMWVAFQAPHKDHAWLATDNGVSGTPTNWNLGQVPSFNVAEADKPQYAKDDNYTESTNIESYYKVLRAVDRAINAIITQARLRTSNDLLAIYVSDNGFLLGEHRLAKKSAPYLPSCRVPMHARWYRSGGMGTVPRTDTALVGNVDIATTIAGACGVSLGYSTPNAANLASRISANGSGEVRTAWMSCIPNTEGNVPTWYSITKPDGWRYWKYEGCAEDIPGCRDDGFTEMYHSAGTSPTDPHELDNRVADEPSRAAAMALELETLIGTLDNRPRRDLK